MECNGTERSGMKHTFHSNYLDILRESGTKFSFHCLESKRNGMSYNFSIPFLPYFKNNNYHLELKYILIKRNINH